ncbi:MAG TPA: cytochrome c [Burkholderiales bacterium]|nr:cytochrome c [Burkholderiales bacterium]
MKRILLITGIAAFALAGPAQSAGDVQAGKTKAGTCAACHGANGEGKSPNPALAGKAEAQLVQALKDYKSGKRTNAVMKTFATPLSEQDMANLAAYYASLKGK